MIGYSEAELLTRTFQDITHADDLKADLENVRRMLAGESRSYLMEKRYVHARGHLVSVLLNVYHFPGSRWIAGNAGAFERIHKVLKNELGLELSGHFRIWFYCYCSRCNPMFFLTIFDP